MAGRPAGRCARRPFSTGGHDRPDRRRPPACWQESTARLDAIKDVTPPEATLKSTDRTDLGGLSWYTTPEGSRIAEIDTQGDQTGGVVISWVIIGGADGFVVNPSQFVLPGRVVHRPGHHRGPNPTDHEVADGVMYQSGIHDSRLSDDRQGRAGGYV